jgi:Cu+-exporting ATPase
MSTSAQPQQKIQLQIEGMSCASCVGRVERSLKKIAEVSEAQVNLATETATVLSQTVLDPQLLVDAVEKAGYGASVLPSTDLKQLQLRVEGMSCASCVGRVERSLMQIPGVIAAEVNLATETAQLRLNRKLDPQCVLDTLHKAGYPAQLLEPTSALVPNDLTLKRQQEAQQFSQQLWLALSLALPVVMLEMGGHLIPALHHWITAAIGDYNWPIQFILCSLLMIFPGRRFYQLGLPALWRGTPDMNSLVALGTLAAYSYSVVATFWPQLLGQGQLAVYYESAVVIICLILFGRFLEAKAKGRSSQAIAHLIGLQPQTAHVWRDAQWIEIPIQAVQRQDILLIKPGEKIPSDGIVIEGNSHVDESMLSGEAIPCAKQLGDRVIGGTINQQGSLQIRCSAVGADTVLAQIVAMVEQAQAAKLPIQNMVDKITLWFVPAVLLLAAVTFVVWWICYPAPALAMALISAVSVLIVACPCAMGLATPTSIMVGTGRAAQLGILFRNGEALQQLTAAQVVAFDKTGTLTQGKAELSDFEVMAGQDRQQLLAYAASIEAQSEHPIAVAMVRAALQQQLDLLPISEFQSIAGYGVQAKIANQQLSLGAARLMQHLGLSIDAFAGHAQQLAAQGKTPFFLAIETQVLAIFAVADGLKPESAAVIQHLQSLGLKVALISGDQQRTAEYVAQQLGIDQVVAEVLPQQKVDAIEALKGQYGTLAYVGDGINDAPALAAADIGIAIGTGTDIAIESADVVLMSGDLQGISNAIALSKACIGNIKQNLFWAFAYNVALIPIAAGLLYPVFSLRLSPMFAAAAMALSSVFVLTNALRLSRFKPNHSI